MCTDTALQSPVGSSARPAKVDSSRVRLGGPEFETFRLQTTLDPVVVNVSEVADNPNGSQLSATW